MFADQYCPKKTSADQHCPKKRPAVKNTVRQKLSKEKNCSQIVNITRSALFSDSCLQINTVLKKTSAD